ncbi:uncharacterized protein HD556DRAFT_1445772 [Suillus plorans]|uniref:Uncharacterized protein n=1 Tax=Suillus plorans TaxID=116603 RepID=A0A9P7AL35_9AGAM|nr:uncharacterized protein HD556DRAFT_1445772 [Suillus plorans]KAG1790759.1 hypothetical protein HD556DRAFT_1445772 [Suillus plorans]
MSRPPSASTPNSHSTSAFYQPLSASSQPHRALHFPPVAGSPLAQFSCPAPLLTTRLPATSSSSQPAMSSLSPPASSWPSLPHYAPIATPYSRNPRVSATQVSPSFGVPHAGIPMSTTAGHSHVRSNRKTAMPYLIPVKQVSEKQVDIVIFPNDIHAAPAAPDSVDDIFEDTYLHFGLVHRIPLTASSRNEIIMNQVYNSVLTISTSHNIQFPPEPECSFDLDTSAPNREFWIQFQHLLFHLLKIGYQMPKGHYLSFDATETWQDYAFHALSKRVNRIQHPTDPNVGLLIIYEEELEYQGLEPGDTVSVECKAFCPLIAGTSRHSQWAPASVPSPIDSDGDLYAPPTILGTPDDQPQVLPDISSPATSLSSILSLSLNSLPALANPQTSFSTVIDLTLPSPNHSSHLPHSPLHSPIVRHDSPHLPLPPLQLPIIRHQSVYASPTPPPYETLLKVDDAIMRAFGSEVEHGMVHVRGPTVKACAEGLIDLLCQQQRDSDSPYAHSYHVNERFSIQPHTQKLSDIFGKHWIFRAGYKMVPMMLLVKTLDKNGFHVLHIRDFPSPSDIEHAFALGAICTMMMIRGHIAPDPISPALLVTAFAGVEALSDKSCVEALFPDHYEDLGLLPSSPHDLTTSVFQAGINIQLSTTHQSVIQMLKSSSKWLLSRCYHRRITNGEQVISRLDFSVCGDFIFESVTAPPLVVQLRSVFEHYFRGIGHPQHPQMADLVNEAQQDIDNADPAYRACRFVKLLRGVTLLPPPGQYFTIYVHQTIPETVCFAGQYHRDDDLLPPSIHACNYSMDMWFNRKMMHILGRSPLSNSDIAELEFMLHCVVFDAGQDSFT